MINNFSPKVSQILAFSREEAARLASAAVGPEHLLLGMLRDKSGPVQDLLLYMDIDFLTIKNGLEQKVRNEEADMHFNAHELVLDDRASRILKLAVLEARLRARQTVDETHLLLAILHDGLGNGAREVLEFNNMKYEDALAFFQKKAGKIQDGIDIPEEEDMGGEGIEPTGNSTGARHETMAHTREKQGNTPVIDKFGIDLTKAAVEGKLDPIVGREKEIMRVTEILCRRKKNNPILIGEPGVGKSAIVEGLAQLIAKNQTSPILFGKRVISLDMTAIVAGTKYRGQFEERIRALIQEIERNSNLIVFIDEIHTLIGAGSTPGSMDAANIMKPALARGAIQCIGATTLDEYRKSIEKDGALERRFQKVIVEPTTSGETLEILHNIKDRYESHHRVTYTEEALKACVKLTERFVSDRFFPDKAIDALDETGAYVHLKHVQVSPEIREKEKEIGRVKERKQAAVRNQNFELAASYRDRQCELEAELERLKDSYINGSNETRETVSEADVADVVSRITGVPVQQMAEAEGIRLKGMAGELRRCVIGQDGAIEKIVKAIQRNRLGLRSLNHPIGAFMFLGPTGTGKTFLAKKLAEFMFGSADALIRIDMSEYSESFNTSRLVGAPPGYVGYEEGGQLTEKVRRHPYSIVLLDEIEKAHGNVFNMLLQVLDEGRLTDGYGRVVDFRNTVIIMTSNVGTRQLKDFGHGIGFGQINDSMDDDMHNEHARSIISNSLSKQFSPEFLNRMDEIITFDQLGLDSIKKIIDIELSELFARIREMGYDVTITDEAKEFVATKGYDRQYGARPLKRAIQKYIEDGICDVVLNGDVKPGDSIDICKDADKDGLKFCVKGRKDIF